jgi:uncharacterized membrane protein YgcG
MRARLLLAALAGLALPVALAVAVYAAAGRSLAAASVADPVTTRAIAQPRPGLRQTPTTATEDRKRDGTRSDDRSDPADTTTVDDDGGSNSGPGSSNSDSGSSNSGSGSDDSSGSGSSGSGSGDD